MTKLTLQMHPDAGDATVVLPVPVNDTNTPQAGGALAPVDFRGLQGLPNSPAAPVVAQPLILGKFKTQADLEKAYQEAERKLHGGKPPAPEPTPDPAADAGKPPVGAPPGSLSEADITSYNQEVLANGTLSAGSLDEIVKKTGLPRATVENYVSMMRQTQQQKEASMLNEVGGQDALNAMAEWARNGFDAHESREFNEAMKSGDEARTRVQLRYLKAKYEANNSTPPGRTLTGTGPSTPAVQPYESWAQVEAATADPRYREDPAYRNAHYQRLSISSPVY